MSAPRLSAERLCGLREEASNSQWHVFDRRDIVDLIDDLRDARAVITALAERIAHQSALLAQRAEGGWRPIAEAPRDGTEVIGFGPDGYVCWWYHGRWYSVCGEAYPTHFQPYTAGNWRTRRFPASTSQPYNPSPTGRPLLPQPPGLAGGGGGTEQLGDEG